LSGTTPAGCRGGVVDRCGRVWVMAEVYGAARRGRHPVWPRRAAGRGDATAPLVEQAGWAVTKPAGRGPVAEKTSRAG